MSSTATTGAPQIRPARTAARATGAATAALFAVALFMTVASVDVPHEPSDQELLTWWQDSGNRTAGVLSGMWALLSACTIAVVMNHLHTLTAAAKAPRWLAFARSMAAAVTAVWLVTGAARAAIGHLVDVMDEPLPGVDVLRAATAFNYTLLGLSGMAVLGLFILAVSVVVLRTRALGRWLGYVGVGCAVVMIAAVVAQYGAFTTPLGILWALCLAVAIWRQPDPA
jgi:CDP-diglyceride synthetase